MKDVVIISTPHAGDSNEKAISLLVSCGYSSRHRNSFAAGFVTVSQEYDFIANDAQIKAGDCNCYFASELTLELVATFPNAKPLTPQGPWEFDGRTWEIDGDEKRRPVEGEVYFHDTVTPYEPYRCKLTNGKFWILRPIISEEKQKALDELDSLRDSHSAMTEQMLALHKTIDLMV